MTRFAKNREFRKIDFELKMYQLDHDLNIILKDIETSDDPNVIKKHADRVGYLIETYKELVLSGIKLDIAYDENFMSSLMERLFDKFCELI